MKGPQVWMNTEGEPHYVVAFTDGVFYADSVDTSKTKAIVDDIMEGEDPAPLLGKSCQRAALDDITRVIADNKGNLVLEVDGTKAVKISMLEQGVKILEAIQDEKGQSWASDVYKRVRVGSAFMALIIGALVGAGLIWVYYGVEGGQINRIQWLVALLINTFGSKSLLVLAGLFFLGGVIGFVYYLTHPAEVWTLEED